MKSFESRIGELRKKFEGALAGVKNDRELEDLRNEFLSRKRGHLTLLFDELKSLSAEEKPSAGKLANDLKLYVQGRLKSFDRDGFAKPALSKPRRGFESPRVAVEPEG